MIPRLIACLILLLLFPGFLVLALVIRMNLGSPILFKQIRPGYKGKPFTLIKFRTMRNAVSQNGEPLPDAERLTRFGRFLRSTSLDELPELINIVRGEMAFVGPRPLLMEYLPLYTAEHMRRHDVLPGITGWAQVNGRNAIGWEKKFTYDVWYVDNRSVWLDWWILIKTAWKVVRRDDIASAGEATARPFSGVRSSTPSGEEK